MSINEIPYIARYYDIIIQNEDVFNEVKNKYPELEIDLSSSKENPNCQCKNKVIEYLTVKLNLKDDESFLKNLINAEKFNQIRNDIDKNWEFIIEQRNDQEKNKSFEFSTPGKIYKVEKNDQAWLNFVTKIRASLMFQSFSVLDKETHLEVYFI